MDIGGALARKWLEGGVNVWKEEVVTVTNLDGRHCRNRLEHGHKEDASHQSRKRNCKNKRNGESDNAAINANPRKSCCSITSQLMKQPVVANNGHTHKQGKIWHKFAQQTQIQLQITIQQQQLKSKSPLTGAVLPHLNLVPNNVLLSTFTR